MPANNVESEWDWVFENYQQTPTQAFLRAFHIGAESGANAFIEEIQKSATDNKLNGDLLYAQIYMEYLYFYLHLLDRNVFAELGPEKRAKFIDDFVFKAFSNAIAFFFKDGDKKKLFKVMGDGYNEASEQYLPYQDMLAPKEKPTSENALAPQLAKRIADILRLSSDDFITKFSIGYKAYSPIIGFQVVVDLGEWSKGPIMEMGLKKYKSVKLVDEAKQKRIEKLNEEFSKKD
jgi:hypothetical protein